MKIKLELTIKKAAAVGFATIALSVALPSHALLISYDFTATQSSATGMATSGSIADIAQGFNTISGSFNYDTSTPDTLPSSTQASYATGSILLNEFSQPSILSRATVEAGSSFNRFQVEEVAANLDTIQIRLIDSSASAFSSDQLPTMLSLSSFNSAFVRFLDFNDNATQILSQVDFTIDTLQPSNNNTVSVPEPTAIGLILSALAGIRLLRRNK